MFYRLQKPPVQLGCGLLPILKSNLILDVQMSTTLNGRNNILELSLIFI
jgi:hypothetical protein